MRARAHLRNLALKSIRIHLAAGCSSLINYISAHHKSVTLIFVAYGIICTLHNVACTHTSLAFLVAGRMYVLHLWDLQLSP